MSAKQCPPISKVGSTFLVSKSSLRLSSKAHNSDQHTYRITQLILYAWLVLLFVYLLSSLRSSASFASNNSVFSQMIDTNINKGVKNAFSLPTRYMSDRESTFTGKISRKKDWHLPVIQIRILIFSAQERGPIQNKAQSFAFTLYR